MSHIFISYSHKNVDILQTVLKYLDNSGFSEDEIWYDEHIDLSKDWRDEIAIALEEAFVLLFLVTKDSLNSDFCTYEWSYALGYGTPVIPCVFEDIEFKEMPAPLATKQSEICTDTIPMRLSDALKSLNRVQPDEIYLSAQILEKAYPIRALIRLYLWIVKHSDILEDCDEALLKDIEEYTFSVIRSFYGEDFTEFFLKYFNSFTTKQRRNARELLQLTREFWSLRWSSTSLVPIKGMATPIQVNIDEGEQILLSIDTIFAYFQTLSEIPTETYYKEFCSILDGIVNKERFNSSFFSIKYPLKIVTNAIIDEELSQRVFMCLENSFKGRAGDWRFW